MTATKLTVALICAALTFGKGSDAIYFSPQGDSGQKPITAGRGNIEGHIESLPKGHNPHKLIKQNDTLCDTGANQWTGTVNLGEGRDMFFWYHESRKSPENDPLIIWINGGPGASSMFGALHEVGPCIVNKAGANTWRNRNSWVNLGNMLFIDQPIGVGFSTTKDRSLWTTDVQSAAIDFDKFLDGFFSLFPALDARDIHFTGESYGGKYVPFFAAQTRRRFASLILVDAIIDQADTALGYYEHLCLARPHAPAARPPLANATACVGMAAGYANCGRAGDACRATYDPSLCRLADTACRLSVTRWAAPLRGTPNPYDDRLACGEPPVCGGLGSEEVEAFANSARVQRALGLEGLNFTALGNEFNDVWFNREDAFLPTSRELVQLLDVTRTPILVINGNNDIIINTASIKRIYDGLRWSGQALFLTKPFKSWQFVNSKGEQTKGGEFKTAGNLSLVTVDEAGHMSPENQPEACLQILGRWIAKEPLQG